MVSTHARTVFTSNLIGALACPLLWTRLHLLCFIRKDSLQPACQLRETPAVRCKWLICSTRENDGLRRGCRLIRTLVRRANAGKLRRMQRRYVTADVFTDRIFKGNPLAVVLDAAGLTTPQMQAIATEFNYSETTFVLAPRHADHTAHVECLLRESKCPSPGIPTSVLPSSLPWTSRRKAARRPIDSVFEEAAGLVPISILRDGGTVSRCRTNGTGSSVHRSISFCGRRGGLSVTCFERDSHRDPRTASGLGRAAFLAVEVTSRDDFVDLNRM